MKTAMHTNTLITAVDTIEPMEGEIDLGIDVTNSIISKPFTRRFIEYLESRNYSVNTIKFYSIYLRRFLWYIYRKHIPLDNVTQQVIESFRVTIKTIQGQRIAKAALNMFFKYRFIVFGDPVPTYHFEVARAEFKMQYIPEANDIIRMMQSTHLLQGEFLKRRAKVIMEILISTAIRESELFTIKLADIDFENNRLLVHGKGKKERYVPLLPTTIEAIRNYLNCHSMQTEYLLYTKGSKRPLTHSNLAVTLKNLKIKAGIDPKKRITAHSIRRFIASAIVNSDDPNPNKLVAVQNLLGHTNLQTTSRYIAMSVQQSQETILKLHPFNTATK